MRKILFCFILLFVGSFSFMISQQETRMNQDGLKQSLKYNGKGFTTDLQTILLEAITDSIIFYSDNYFSQADYIIKRLEQTKKGLWHIVIIKDLTISKITDVSTGFYYWNQGETWALWYEATNFAKNLLHLVIYNGEGEQSIANVSTSSSTTGSGVSADTAKVISSIAQTLDTTQDIAKYIQKYDGQKWSVLSVPFTWGSKYPEAYAALSVGTTYITYNKNVTLQGTQYSQIIYV